MWTFHITCHVVWAFISCVPLLMTCFTRTNHNFWEYSKVSCKLLAKKVGCYILCNINFYECMGYEHGSWDISVLHVLVLVGKKISYSSQLSNSVSKMRLTVLKCVEQLLYHIYFPFSVSLWVISVLSCDICSLFVIIAGVLWSGASRHAKDQSRLVGQPGPHPMWAARSMQAAGSPHL